jgi:hypothetical protein
MGPVLIGRDFRQSKADETGRPGALPRAEAIPAYVAVTRAQRTLDRGGLAWIDDQLAGRARPNGGRRRGWGEFHAFRYGLCLTAAAVDTPQWTRRC